jgi:tellurite methyltransferase
MSTNYDEKYGSETYYWGKQPSCMCYKVLQVLPPETSLRLLDIGCGEGRNAIFFARNGYLVSGFDLSNEGLKKTREWAEQLGLSVEVFQADVIQHRLQDHYDVLFSSGTLQYIPKELRVDILANYKRFSNPGAIHAFTVPVVKPFIPKAPDVEETEHDWISGELMTHYHDWRIEYCTEEILDYVLRGVPYQFAVNRIIAKKPSDDYS